MAVRNPESTGGALPRLQGFPVIGNLPAFQRDRIAFLRRLNRECGDLGRVRLARFDALFVNSPDLVHDVLVTHAAKVRKGSRVLRRANLTPLVGNGLLTNEGADHRRQRKLIAPSFQPRHIASYAEVMAANAERIAASWRDGATVDIAEEMMRLTLWIIGKTLFDADVLQEAGAVHEALTTAMHVLQGPRSLAAMLPAWVPNPGVKQLALARARLDQIIFKIIAERRRSGEDRGDLLSVLLRAQDEDDGAGMTDAQVRDEAMTLFLAGHETTANALAWTWYLLSRDQAAYQGVRAEVDRVLAGRTPTHADLPSLPYTLQVLKESMRLYPPAYIMARVAIEPFTLREIAIAPGQLILISPFTLHRRSAPFPRPEHFNPARFAPEAEAQLPRHAYMPFGTGPRACIGNHFAMMEAQLLVATLAQRVTLALVPGQQIRTEPLVTLRPKGGIQMTVLRRTLNARGSHGSDEQPAVINEQQGLVAVQEE